MDNRRCRSTELAPGSSSTPYGVRGTTGPRRLSFNATFKAPSTTFTTGGLSTRYTPFTNWPG
ncbi:hypothetical protein SEUCBS139899_002813 [Sporothrix eucalyptigena]|uniref:Uncharacterized protein n=1 Tax=Sporothrix eucalyptigena TaxID=1812306 RepID=A0ABP0CFY4_9PEZI